jgi:hypothetical protein
VSSVNNETNGELTNEKGVEIICTQKRSWDPTKPDSHSELGCTTYPTSDPTVDRTVVGSEEPVESSTADQTLGSEEPVQSTSKFWREPPLGCGATCKHMLLTQYTLYDTFYRMES